MVLHVLVCDGFSENARGRLMSVHVLTEARKWFIGLDFYFTACKRNSSSKFYNSHERPRKGIGGLAFVRADERVTIDHNTDSFRLCNTLIAMFY